MKLIVLDCDGVLSKGEACPFDAPLMERLAQMNRRARAGESVPAITLNTGRPSPYVEAVMQMLHGWQPALFENGAGLYFPQTYQFVTTPLLTSERVLRLQDVVQEIGKQIVQTGDASWQPGKSTCYTLFASPERTTSEILSQVQSISQQTPGELMVSVAQEAINIHPLGIDKGTGLQWLAEVTQLPVSQMGGVGDSVSDMAFLKLVGWSAAPWNADGAVKSLVDYVSQKTDAAGLHDILDYWCAL